LLDLRVATSATRQTELPRDRKSVDHLAMPGDPAGGDVVDRALRPPNSATLLDLKLP
jgi:hypothetical protein